MAKKNSPMKQMIKESLREMKDNPSGEFPSDPTLNEDGEVSGPERFAKTQLKKDEVIVDRLLAPIATKEGYFLKLKKEVRIGEWMLMKVIKEEWRRWADMESSISDIVREHTRHMPQKWGTGNYRIEFACDGGMRGENYKDRDFLINAEEEFIHNQTPGTAVPLTGTIVDPNLTVASRIEELTNLVNMLSGVLPKPPDPSKTQEQIADAFKQGMSLKVGESGGNNQIMATVMTGLFGLMTAMMTRNNDAPRVVNPDGEGGLKGMLETLKNFGVLGNQQPQEKPKTVIEFVTELKALGMDLFEKKDPIAQITQLKQLASIASEFMGLGGTGDKPGILEKIVDTVAPMLPGMIKDIKETASNAVEVQKIAGQNIERAKISMTSTPVQEGSSGNQMNVGTAMPAMSAQLQAFFNGLYDAVNQNNRMFYPIIYTSLLQDAQGQALLTGITTGTHTAQEVIELLQTHGGDRYKDSAFVMKKLVSYTNGFIIWIREMMKSQSSGMNAYGKPSETGHESIREAKPSATSYDAQCPLCQTVFAFENEQAYIEEKEKECGIEHNGVMCPGMIQPIVKAS